MARYVTGRPHLCDPITAGAVLAVASTTAGVISQAKQAKAQTKAINQQQAVVAEENRRAASAELFDQMRASRREQARIRTASGEAGLSLQSGSIESMLLDSAMQSELQGTRTMANLESRQAATKAEAASALSQISKPTALGAGLQIASSAADGWAKIEKVKISKPKTKKQ